MAKQDQTLIGVVSYITFIGWVVALILFVHNKTPFTRLHIRQSLLIHIIGFLFGMVPVVGLIAQVIWLVLAIWGIYLAANKRKEHIPVVGEIAEKLFGAL